MPPSEAQKRAADKYNREHMATLGCKVTKKQAESFKAHCQSKGSTTNKVLRDFVIDSINAFEASPAPDEAAPAADQSSNDKE